MDFTDFGQVLAWFFVYLSGFTLFFFMVAVDSHSNLKHFDVFEEVFNFVLV